MKQRKQELILLYISIVSFFLMSALFLVMPLENVMRNEQNISYPIIIGSSFWLMIVVGLVSQFVLIARIRKCSKCKRVKNGKKSDKRRIGFLMFLSNRIAAAFDLSCAVSLIALIVSIIITKATGYICYVLIAVFSFSFCMHCILNGRIYYHITNHYEKKERHCKQNNKKESNDDGNY